jgi:hypothetical protein
LLLGSAGPSAFGVESLLATIAELFGIALHSGCGIGGVGLD